MHMRKKSKYTYGKSTGRSGNYSTNYQISGRELLTQDEVRMLVCLEGAIIVLACIIFSVFAASPPVVAADATPVTMVWTYMGELIFNLLVLTGAVKMADRVVREMFGL